MNQWYEKLFANYGAKYELEPFTKGTLGEVDFIEHEIQHNRTVGILDIGCGTGRHAIELALRGYAVTGVDLSESMLNEARKKAESKKMDICFMQADARYLSFSDDFDLVLMLCEGAFPLMETDEMNYQILQGAYNALRSSGKLIMTTLNALYPIFNGTIAEDCPLKIWTGEQSSFDLITFREDTVMSIVDNDQQTIELKTNERYYTPAEMKWLLKSAGFKQVDVFGCTLGAFSREEPLNPNHFEMLIVATV